jgi:adenylate cyclase class IV
MIMQEVEVRGPLDKMQFRKFNSWLRKNAEFEGKKRRLLIDFTPFNEDKMTDVRARLTNGEAEIIVKRGAWLGENRKEISVHLGKDNFKNALELLGSLGYKKGMLTLRNISKYLYRGIEFSLVEVVKVDKKLKETKGFSFFYEAEMLVPEKNSKQAKKHINETLSRLGLPKFRHEEFVRYVKEELNPKSNIVFDVDNFNLNLMDKQ